MLHEKSLLGATQNERDREKRATMLVRKGLISEEGLALIQLDPNLEAATLKKLEKSEKKICEGTKNLPWYFDSEDNENDGSGLTILSMLIKEDLDQTLSDIAEKYALLRKVPYLYAIQALTELYAREGCLYFFTIKGKNLRRHKWYPKRVLSVPIQKDAAQECTPTANEEAWLSYVISTTTPSKMMA